MPAATTTSTPSRSRPTIATRWRVRAPDIPGAIRAPAPAGCPIPAQPRNEGGAAKRRAHGRGGLRGLQRRVWCSPPCPPSSAWAWCGTAMPRGRTRVAAHRRSPGTTTTWWPPARDGTESVTWVGHARPARRSCGSSGARVARQEEVLRRPARLQRVLGGRAPLAAAGCVRAWPPPSPRGLQGPDPPGAGLDGLGWPAPGRAAP